MVSYRTAAKAALLFSTAAQAASADFYIHAAVLGETLVEGLNTIIQYTPDGSVGIFPYCSDCYNFTVSITDEGYIELIDTADVFSADSVFLNVHEDTGLLTVNETASSDQFEIVSHLLYYNGSLSFTLLETSVNHTYLVYYGEDDDSFEGQGTPFNVTLVPRFANGSYYLYYDPSESTDTEALSLSITQIPTAAATKSAESTSSTEAATSSTSASSSGIAAGVAAMGSVPLVGALAAAMYLL